MVCCWRESGDSGLARNWKSEGEKGHGRRESGLERACKASQRGAVPTPHPRGSFGHAKRATCRLILRLWLGDQGGGLLGIILPAVDELPGADEDARAGRGLAVAVNVELPDVAVARFRGGQAAEDREVVGVGDARTARGSAED